MKYLIFYGNGIGDFVTVMPLAQLIKQNDKDAKIVCFNVSDKNKIKINRELLELQTSIDDIEYYSQKELLHSISFVLGSCANKFDYSFIVLHEDNESASLWPYYICKLISKHIVGYEMCKKPQMKFATTCQRNEGKAFVKVYMDMARLIGLKEGEVHFPLFDLDKLQENSKFSRMQYDVCLCVGTGVIGMRLNGRRVEFDTKNWGIMNWIELASLLKENHYSVALLGGRKEASEMENIKVPDNVDNLCGKLSIADSIRVLNCTRIVVGADTGLMHCAAALDKKNITLFGCTSEKQYLPYGNNSKFINMHVSCSPCFGTEKAVTCDNRVCMTSITVDEVYKEICRYI